MERIRTSQEIRTILRHGTAIHSRWCRFVYVRTRQGTSRIGVIVTRRLGGAVDRNRAKRRMREILRRDTRLAACGLDLVVIPKQAVIKEKFGLLSQNIHKMIMEICV